MPEPIRIVTQADLAGIQQFTASTQEAGAAAAAMSQKFSVASSSASGLERAAAMATGRIAGMSAGMGMAGGAIGRVAAMLPGLGPLFAVAFPATLIAMAAEKISQLGDEIRKQNEDAAGMVGTTSNVASALALENLRLDDQIAKLELRPTHNKLAEALVEAKMKADELGRSLSSDIEKSFALTEQDWGSKLLYGTSADLQNFSDGVKQLFVQISEAKLKLAEAPAGSDAAKAALQTEIGLYQEIAQAAKTASNVAADENQKGRIDDLAVSALNAAAALKEMQQYSAKSVTVAGNEQRKDIVDFNKQIQEMNDKLREGGAEYASYWMKQFDGLQADSKAAAELARSYDTLEANAKRAAEAQKESTQDLIEGAKVRMAQMDAEVAAAQRAAQSSKEGSPWGALTLGPQKAELSAIGDEINKLKLSMNELSIAKSKLADLPYITPEQHEQIIALQNAQDQTREKIVRLEDEYQKLSIEISNQAPWKQMQNDMQTAFTAGFQSFNQGFIQMLERGKSFTAALQQLWNGMASSFITSVLKMGEKWVEEHILMAAAKKAADLLGLATHTTTVAAQIAANKALAMSEAGLAGAAGVASFAAAPWPIDMGAPAFGASMMAAAAGMAAFEQGGIIPGSLGDVVPMIGHAQEMVLPAHVTNWVMRAAAGDSEGGGNTQVHFHGNFSSFDPSGMDRVLSEHGGRIAREMMRRARKRAWR